MGQAKWPIQTSSHGFMHDPQTQSVGHTMVNAIVNCAEKAGEMGPVLETESKEFAEIDTLQCGSCGDVPLDQYFHMDLKAHSLEDRHATVRCKWGCPFCLVNTDDLALWPDDINKMKAGPRKTALLKKVGQPRTMAFALTCAELVVGVKDYAVTAAIMHAIKVHCSVRGAAPAGEARAGQLRFKPALLKKTLEDRGIVPTVPAGGSVSFAEATKRAQLRQLADAMRAEGPGAQGAIPAWEPLEDVLADSPLHDDIIHFSTGTDPAAIAGILRCHPPLYHETAEYTFGHVGVQCSPLVPMDQRSPGVWHVGNHHATMLFCAKSACANACDGDDNIVLQKFGDVLVKAKVNITYTRTIRANAMRARAAAREAAVRNINKYK
jgi:hypothetical protein